ncbi:MAG: hypothetical protein IH627_06770 [Rubrivivax sp.]|nr:hypothetical protein [Rubrivivax sp.]
MAVAQYCLLVSVACVALGSCGGGAPADVAPQAATRLAVAPSPRPYGVVSAPAAVEQLLDFGESTYGMFFTGHKPTQSFERYLYRHYPETGVYLGVAVSVIPGDGLVESGVYVMGGEFGTVPKYVGLLADYVTPARPMNSVLPAAPTLSAVYVAQLPSAPKGAGAPCSNRAAWALATAKVTAITAQADAKLGQSFPPWNEGLYMAWRTSGLHESMMADRKGWLYSLLIAECAAWQGKYIPTINTVLRSLATQPTWIAPSQDHDLQAYNNGQWFMDLMSASMAHELAQTLYMLGDKVDSETRRIVLGALETRVFAPVRRLLTEGIGRGWWLTVAHNWNAVILADVAGAALSVIPSRHDRALFAAMGQHYIQSHLNEYPASGYGIEGPAYWTYGIKHVALLRHRLHESSGGQVDLFASAKMQAIAAFSARIPMSPSGALAPFGDSHVNTSMDRQTSNYVAAAYGTARAWPGTAEVRVNPWFPNDMPTVEAAMLLTESVPLAQGWASTDFGSLGLRNYFSDVGVLVTRSPMTDSIAFAATIKSAGNANHGHDDVGSYAIALDSLMAGDVGRGDYTSRTFSDQRRTVLWINSYGHPVPVVGGRQQVDASTATNTVLSTNFTDNLDEIAINMAPAYALPGGWSLVRSLRNDRVARTIAIQDDFSAFSMPQAFQVPITTVGTWTQLAPDRIEIQHEGQKLQVRIEASAPFFTSGETITDDGLTFKRIAVNLASPATAGWIRVTYSR